MEGVVVYYTYILTDEEKSTLHVGIANDLITKIDEHKQDIEGKGIVEMQGTNKLVYFESHDDFESAAEMETQLNNSPKDKNIDLIDTVNPEWKDLFFELWENA